MNCSKKYIEFEYKNWAPLASCLSFCWYWNCITCFGSTSLVELISFKSLCLFCIPPAVINSRPNEFPHLNKEMISARSTTLVSKDIGIRNQSLKQILNLFFFKSPKMEFFNLKLHSSKDSKLFWFPPQPPYRNSVHRLDWGSKYQRDMLALKYIISTIHTGRN